MTSEATTQQNRAKTKQHAALHDPRPFQGTNSGFINQSTNLKFSAAPSRSSGISLSLSLHLNEDPFPPFLKPHPFNSFPAIPLYDRIHCQQSCQGKEVAGGSSCPSAPDSGARPRPFSAGARPRCRRRPNQPMLMAPAEARREARRARQSPNANPEAVEDLEARSPKFPQNLNRKPEVLVEDHIKRGSVKSKSKP